MEQTRSAAWIRRLRQALGRSENADGDEDPEAGFTLIELMVVLLIMGILLAIAIPTFLSVTGSAKKTAAQSNLTDAVTSATSIYTSTQSFPTTSSALATALHKTQATITFITGSVPKTTAGKNVISVDVSGTSAVVMAALDGKTVCWVAAVNEGGAAAGNIPVGDSYYALKTAGTKCDASTLAGGKVAAATWKKSFATWKGFT